MSGPVRTEDVAPAPGSDERADVVVAPGRDTEVGGIRVRRALPQRVRRTVGAWCFVDHMGPVPVADDGGISIGPHPHIGLQTVTWLLAGAALHRDSLGSEQPIRPGQLNLMSAGRGVSHAEEPLDGGGPALHGVQLWVAQPEATRHGEPAFEHHAALPQVEVGRATATVLVGSLAGVTSPARRDTDHLGADLVVRRGATELPVARPAEHALVVLDGRVRIAGTVVSPGALAYLGPGRDVVVLQADEPARVLLVGGSPFESPVLMWWNFVARTRDEVDAAADSWRVGDDRFGETGSPLARIPAPLPPWRGPTTSHER